MKRVTGIGGIFFKAKDAPALQAWYKRHLGIDVQEWGGTAFPWTDGEGKPMGGTTVWYIASMQRKRPVCSEQSIVHDQLPRRRIFTLWSKSCARKAATFSRRSTIPSTGNLPGSSIQKETR